VAWRKRGCNTEKGFLSTLDRIGAELTSDTSSTAMQSPATTAWTAINLDRALDRR
jgi:hypothetical protein